MPKIKYPAQIWETVDWRKCNLILAQELNLGKAYIRQKRKKLGKPKPIIFKNWRIQDALTNLNISRQKKFLLRKRFESNPNLLSKYAKIKHLAKSSQTSMNNQSYKLANALTDTNGNKPIEAFSVTVGEDIINSSKPCDFNKCMVAEAIQQKYPDATHIYVDTSMIKFTKDGLRYYFIPPQAVKDFIVRFDQKLPVQPFKFKTIFRARVVPAGFYNTHPKGDNRTNPNKKYKPEEKKRKYAKRVRVNGVCHLIPNDNSSSLK